MNTRLLESSANWCSLITSWHGDICEQESALSFQDLKNILQAEFNTELSPNSLKYLTLIVEHAKVAPKKYPCVISWRFYGRREEKDTIIQFYYAE